MATGGSQRVLLLQADWFFRLGYPVTVAFLYDKENLLSVWCSQYKFPIQDLRFRQPTANGLAQAIHTVGGMVRLLRLLRATRYMAVETFALHANLIGLPFAWLTGVPKRIGSHRGKIEGLPPVLERIHAIMINSWITHRLVVVADRVREDAIAEGVRPERIVKIANGVILPKVNSEDVRRVRGTMVPEQDDLILLSVGRLRYQKGHSVLLRAFPSVLSRFPHTKMLIAGDGILREELEAEAKALHIADHVKFLGVRRDVPLLMSLADVFIFPSHFEGMPNAVLEAMSHGLPVIATAVQGVDEVVRDGQNGLLVPPDDPAALSEAILRLLHDPAERRRLGSAARETIERNYTAERMCRQYEELLTGDRSRDL
jgi:glycosyltransferase involved in cell wall biosynthesis